MRGTRKQVSIILLMAATMLVAAAAVSAGGPESLEEAKKMAQTRGVPLLLNVNSEWSSDCKDFQKASTSHKKIRKALSQVVFYTASSKKGSSKELTKNLGVKCSADFVMLTPNGDMINCWSGYAEAADFIKTLQLSIDDPVTVDERVARFKKKPTADDAEVLGRIYSSRYEGKKAIDFYRTAGKLDSDRKAQLVYPIFEASASGIKGKTVDSDMVFKAADGVLKMGSATGEQLCHVAKVTGHVAKKAGTPERQKPYLQAAMNATAGTKNEDLLKFRQGMAVSYALVVEGDTKKALKLKRSSMKGNWTEDAMQLNSFAWWCFENNVNLVEADDLARKGVELASPGKKKAMILDTVAEICNARGSCNSALEYIQLALREDPENEYYQDQFERFLDLVAQAD